MRNTFVVALKPLVMQLPAKSPLPQWANLLFDRCEFRFELLAQCCEAHQMALELSEARGQILGGSILQRAWIIDEASRFFTQIWEIGFLLFDGTDVSSFSPAPRMARQGEKTLISVNES